MDDLDLEINEHPGYFHEVYGFWSGHGYGTMLIYVYEDRQEKWVLFVDEESQGVDIIDPHLYELYLEYGNEEVY